MKNKLKNLAQKTIVQPAKKFKHRFQTDPIFSVAVTITAATIASAILSHYENKSQPTPEPVTPPVTDTIEPTIIYIGK